MTKVRCMQVKTYTKALHTARRMVTGYAYVMSAATSVVAMQHRV
jgi:hypothetical protein